MKIKLLQYVVFSCMFAGMLFVSTPAPADAFYLRVPEMLKRVLANYRSNLAQITTTTTCPSGEYWYTPPGGGAGYCQSQGAACTQAGGTWNSASNYCQMPTCPSGQYWYTSPSGGAGSCVSSAITTCPSGQWWDPAINTCKSSTTTTCSGGQYWNGTSCVNSTTTTCPSGEWWYTPPGGGAGYCQSQSAACTQGGGTWNSASNYCQMPTCPSGQ
ncbi:MAG: hypothetical protein AAB611_02280, partial [Patescibacteria group bacterium]